VVETMLTELRLVGPLGERMALARRLRGARGFHAGGELLAGLFVLSAERAERLALGRQLRGYDERRARSRKGLAWRDVPAVAIALMPALAILAIHTVPRLTTP
jgi:energy-coupling factor transporter transmembrane protein EcfT